VYDAVMSRVFSTFGFERLMHMLIVSSSDVASPLSPALDEYADKIIVFRTCAAPRPMRARDRDVASARGRSGRQLRLRWNPDTEEFCKFDGLCFWYTCGRYMPDDVWR
jgi:hypothetical protein